MVIHQSDNSKRVSYVVIIAAAEYWQSDFIFCMAFLLVMVVVAKGKGQMR